MLLLASLLFTVALCASPVRAASGSSSSCSTNETAMYFGNGVNTTYDRALWEALGDVPGLADDAGIDHVAKNDVAYNHTDGLMLDVIETLRQKIDEDPRFSWYLLNNLTAYTLRGLNALSLVKYLKGQGDFIKSLQDLVNAGIADSGNQPGTFYDSDVADQVSAYANDILNSGYRVIVVAHSQGNLYANAARAQLVGLGAVGSFGIAAVGDPAEIDFDGYVTSSNDQIMNLIRTLGRTVLPANVKVPFSLEDFMGHGFEEIYINPNLPARQPIVSMLSKIASKLPYPAAPIDLGCESGLPIPVGDTSRVLEGVITHGEKQSFTFQANAGNGVQIRLVDTLGTVFIPTYTVYGPTGVAVTNPVSGSDVAALAFTTAMTGVYTIVISDASTNQSLTAEYELYVAVAPGANEGGTLTSGGVVSASLDKGDLDSYTFNAQAGQGIQLRMVDVAGGTMNPTYVVYGPTGAPVTNPVSGSNVAPVAFTTSTAGTYTIIAYDASSGYASTGAYNLYFAIGAGATDSGALTSGGVISASLDEGDLDSYTFNAQAGQGVQLRMVDVAGGTMNPTYVVYGPTGAPVTNPVSGSDVAPVAFTTSTAGTYTIIAYDASSGYASTGAYNLYLAIGAGATDGGALTSGGVISASLDEGDLDSYTFTGQTGFAAHLTMTDTGAGTMNPTFIVYGPTGAPVTNPVSGTDVAAVVFASTSGTYTVIAYDASSGYASTGPYDLTFTLTPPG